MVSFKVILELFYTKLLHGNQWVLGRNIFFNNEYSRELKKKNKGWDVS